MNKPAGGVDVLGGYFTCYEDGRIWSNKSNKLVTGSVSGTGYLRVSYKSYTIAAHRLIAHAFLGLDLESDLTVDHLNGVKTDNRLCNLELVTGRENTQRANRKYYTGSDEVVTSLLETKSWKLSAISLGFSTPGTLMDYCRNTLSLDLDYLSEKIGITRRSSKIANEIRNTYTYKELLELVEKFGTQKETAKVLGVSPPTLCKIMKEKSQQSL